MWLGVAITWSAITLLLVLRACRSLPDFPTRFLLVALWLRYAAQAFPEHTVLKSFAGFSIVALLAIATAGVLIILARRPLLSHRLLLPFYALLGFVVFSSAVNRQIGMNIIEELMKWVYFFGVLTISYRSVLIFGVFRMASALSVAFLLPVILVYFSYLLGISKIANDGSINFIGGYFHEAVVSTMIFSFLCVTSLMTRAPMWVVLSLLAVGVLAIILSNYRTTIIAALPIVALALWTASMRPWPARLKPVVVVTMAMIALAAAPVLLAQLPERHNPIGEILATFDVLAKPPEEITREDRLLLTGRVALWANYISAYAHGDIVNWTAGFGANAWRGRFFMFAHNTFVSYLYEYGAVGLFMLLAIMAGNLALTFRIRDRAVGLRLAVCQIGFVLLNLATMPLSANEGLIIYAILLAFTWSLQPVDGRASRGVSAGRSPPPDRRGSPPRPAPGGGYGQRTLRQGGQDAGSARSSPLCR